MLVFVRFNVFSARENTNIVMHDWMHVCDSAQYMVLAAYLFAQSVDICKGLVAGRVFRRSGSSWFCWSCLKIRKERGKEGVW
jgi:hypothetical protein